MSNSDETEQSNADLIKLKERFELALDGANDGLWDWDLLTNLVFFSPRWKSMLGYEIDEIKNDLDEWSKRVHPDDLQRALDSVKKHIDGDIDKYSIEFRMQHKKGHYVDILSRGKVIREADGTPTRLIGTHVDISLRKNAELKFRTIYESSSDAIMLLDDTGFFDCNQAAVNMFKSESVEQFCNYTPSELSPEKQSDGRNSIDVEREYIGKAFKMGKLFFEWKHKRMDGEVFDAEVLLTPFDISGRKIIQATVRDISERKQAEKLLNERYKELQEANEKISEAQSLLLQSDKMASLGQLAAGVAHEINNPVGFVKSNVGSLQKYIQDLFNIINLYESVEDKILDEKALKNVQDLKEEIELNYLKQDVTDLIKESQDGLDRVIKIVKDLKDFSHAGEAEWQCADIQSGLDSTLNIVHNELKYKAEIIKEYDDIPDITCIPSQLNQVFMNLLVNAAHAIEEKGSVCIRTGMSGTDSVFIEIEDTGCGIAEDKLSRIFDPFFTTKEIGKGTGLGLSLAYGIVEKHKGCIHVESHQGQGTKFRIELPIIPQLDETETMKVLKGSE